MNGPTPKEMKQIEQASENLNTLMHLHGRDVITWCCANVLAGLSVRQAETEEEFVGAIGNIYRESFKMVPAPAPRPSSDTSSAASRIDADQRKARQVNEAGDKVMQLLSRYGYDAVSFAYTGFVLAGSRVEGDSPAGVEDLLRQAYQGAVRGLSRVSGARG